MKGLRALHEAYQKFIKVLIGAAAVCYLIPVLGWMAALFIMLWVGIFLLVEIGLLVVYGLILIVIGMVAWIIQRVRHHPPL